MLHLSITLRFGREREESSWPDYREVDVDSMVERAESVRDEIGFRRDTEWPDDRRR